MNGGPAQSGPVVVEGPRSVSQSVNERVLTRFSKRKRRKQSMRDRAFGGRFSPVLAYTKTPQTNTSVQRARQTALEM